MGTISKIAVSFVLSTVASTLYAMQPANHSMMQSGSSMIDGGMRMGGGMMVACLVFGVLAFIALVLSILALIKYLRGKPQA